MCELTPVATTSRRSRYIIFPRNLSPQFFCWDSGQGARSFFPNSILTLSGVNFISTCNAEATVSRDKGRGFPNFDKSRLQLRRATGCRLQSCPTVRFCMRIPLVIYSRMLRHNRARYAPLLVHRIHRDYRLLSAGAICLRFPGREQFPLAAVNFGAAEITSPCVTVIKRMTRQGRTVISGPRRYHGDRQCPT